MRSPKGCEKRGIALLIVLATILVVTVFASVILTTMSSQSRLTYHQVSRAQAYYAGQAGLVYASEKIKTGKWNTTINCTVTHPCTLTDPDFPKAISQPVRITFRQPGQNNCFPTGVSDICIDVKVNYTYQ